MDDANVKGGVRVVERAQAVKRVTIVVRIFGEEDQVVEEEKTASDDSVVFESSSLVNDASADAVADDIGDLAVVAALFFDAVIDTKMSDACPTKFAMVLANRIVGAIESNALMNEGYDEVAEMGNAIEDVSKLRHGGSVVATLPKRQERIEEILGLLKPGMLPDMATHCDQKECGFDMLQDILIQWDEDHDERVITALLDMPNDVREQLVVIQEHEGGLALRWRGEVPRGYETGKQVEVAGDCWTIGSEEFCCL